jgi:hypothetical protein
MLAELPPTPAPPATSPSSPVRPKISHGHSDNPVLRTSPRGSRRKSPRKSPNKPTIVGKVGASRKVLESRRSSLLGLAEGHEPSFETEVIPSAFPISNLGTMLQSLLPTTFVLPPPSPHSSLPRSPALLSSAALPALNLVAPIATYLQPSTSKMSPSSDSLHEDPRTPPGIHRPFPVAKALATRMIHAYSPARPSPLSRILMLNDSPASPPDSAAPSEGEAEDLPAAVFTKPKPDGKSASNSLAADLGSTNKPLRDKHIELNVNSNGRRKPTADVELKRFTAKEKGKGMADNSSAGPLVSRSRTTGAVEKENHGKAKGNRMSSASSGANSGTKVKMSTLVADGANAVKPAAKSASAFSLGTVKGGIRLAAGKGGARRVPVDSAEVASVGPGWRA